MNFYSFTQTCELRFNNEIKCEENVKMKFFFLFPLGIIGSKGHFENKEIECYSCSVDIDVKTGQAFPGLWKIKNLKELLKLKSWNFMGFNDFYLKFVSGFGDIACKNNISALTDSTISYQA